MHPHLWLPYAQMQTAPEPLRVSRTDGCRIILEDGRELIDGISSWWSACHGYNHPHIRKALEAQLHTMPHVMFAGLTHAPAETLADKLAAMAPNGLERVFFSDSGSTAVEVALKMAVQYWRNQGDSKRSKFVCFGHGYHGDTMGGMSVSDPDRGIHQAFNHYMPRQFVMDIPSGEYSFAEFEAVLGAVHNQVAGVIIEPLVQGAGGMRFHSADVLAEIYRITKAHNLLFIADEVATGFGRTGSMFACDEAGITPDIMCVGKALTGGTMTLAATLATMEVFDAFLDDDMYKALMHGPTYMANPLACSAAQASLELFDTEPRLKQVAAIEQQLHTELASCRSLPGVTDVRVKGAIGVVEYDTGVYDMWELRRVFVEQNVWLRPFGNIVYLAPPFVISSKDLSTLTQAVYKVFTE